MRSIVIVFSVLFATLVSSVDLVAQQKPAIEHSSLLDAFTVKFRGKQNFGKTGGQMILNQKHEIMGVFIPENAAIKVNLYKANDSKSLYESDCRTARSGGSAFNRIEVIDPAGYTFHDQGDYELKFSIDGNVISTMPFNVFFKKQGDDFDPKTYTFVDGDWSNLAYLSTDADKKKSPLKFHTWTRKVVFTTTPEASKMDVTLLQGDDVVAVTAEGTIAWPEWQSREVTFAFPDNQGGRVFNNTDLMARSGKHTVRVDIDGKPHQYFNFDVRDGKIVGHERQAMDFKDRTRWLCPRKIRLGLEGTSHVFWMERSKTAAKVEPEKVAGPSTSTKSKWTVTPDIDPSRPFRIVQTAIQMRKDMPVSIGDGIVAYATGSRGVGYFVVGENKPRSIKDGQSFRGDLFFACGKLIMMATRNNVTVFSTEVERSVEIPDNEIHLAYQKHSMYGPRYADADGYLIATVNEPQSLKSKSIINVIDLSGDTRPIVIPIKNADFELRDVTSIKVNAAAGKVAVGSKRKSAIYVADVAAGASFRKYDLSGFDSFGENNMVLTKDHILYTDAAGFANVRMLDLDSGQVTMPQPSLFGGGWGPVGASNGSTFAWAIKEPQNAWAIGQPGSDGAVLSNTGQKSELGSFGQLGSGRSMAMAEDGTVMIAGTRSISTSNCLQIQQGDRWQMVAGEDGQPIPAIDIVADNSMAVFRTGQPSTSSMVKLAYATFGSKITLPDSGGDVTDSRGHNPLPSGDSKTKPLPQSKVESDVASEVDRERLKVTIESEETIFQALKLSLGEKEARKRARETALKALKASGGEHLIEEYRKSWK